MRATVYCESCKQTVWKDDVHSCWDESARAQDQKVRDAERIVLSRAVEFDEALNTYYTGESGEDQKWRVYLDNLTKAEKALRAAVAKLLAAEAAA
jgi:hypothetical protein